LKKINLDYVTSKLDYKTSEVIDLYTLRIRRSQEEIREDALKEFLGVDHIDHIEEQLQNQTL